MNTLAMISIAGVLMALMGIGIYLLRRESKRRSENQANETEPVRPR